MTTKFKNLGRTGTVLSKKQVYDGPIFKLYKETIKTPDGLEVERDLIDHGNAVTILAMTADDQVVLGSEYRVGRNAETVSLPAGLINGDEDPLVAAKRELQEETGYVAHDSQVMTAITSSEGFTNETVTLVLTHIDANERAERHFDHDEYVNTQLVPLAEVIAMMKRGEIRSAQGLCALNWYLNFVREA
ncbi:NUDIX hydrolase [Lactiplantibacillus fabifermentans T30PCM01]|uniref:NUDIX hydrolase n=1 Tax=Lactiplantibacillus fabifermentans T30PCM01 TaxID=1400520 RepID=W6T5P9_9LACO|nr:NUDIX hydrolase [Lactiplantibacillus fabifermentans]ETY73431.1 NUDIX hydrolase [Lactiplantibacillus fabifermentans T30PCM01]